MAENGKLLYAFQKLVYTWYYYNLLNKQMYLHIYCKETLSVKKYTYFPTAI